MGMVSEVSMWGSRKRRNRQDDAATESDRASAETAVIRPAVSGLYVDLENLQGYDFAQRFLVSLTQNWPADIPPLGIVRLYARADTQVLWEMWSDSQFADVGVAVKGVQHFSKNASKNSADIALALDAVCDLMTDSVQHVVVVSDDSDFAALFGKIREIHIGRQGQTGRTPFLWIMTNREHTRSRVVMDFSPNDYIHIFKDAPDRIEETDTAGHLANAKQDAPDQTRDTSNSQVNGSVRAESVPIETVSGASDIQEIAKAIIRTIPAGTFKSTDCQPIIRKGWPQHKMAKLKSAPFGIAFASDVLPHLKAYGVSEPNPKRKPRQFQMTDKAKRKVSQG